MPDDARQHLMAELHATEASDAPSEQPRAAPGPLRFTVPTVEANSA